MLTFITAAVVIGLAIGLYLIVTHIQNEIKTLGDYEESRNFWKKLEGPK